MSHYDVCTVTWFSLTFVGQTRDAVPGPVQAGQAVGRDDDRTADGGNAQLPHRTHGDTAVLPVDEHAEDVGHGTGGPEQRRVQRQRRRGNGRGHVRLWRRWRLGRRWRWRGRHVDERQRERDGTHHVARIRRHDTHEEAQRRRPV